MNEDYISDPSAEPDPFVVALERAVRRHRYRPRPLDLHAGRAEAGRYRRRRIAIIATAATLLFAAGARLVWNLTRPAPWSIELLEGSAAIAETEVVNGTRLGQGQSLHTRVGSRARINVGGIGVADLGPGSQVELIDAGEGEHRLALRHGTLYATIWAPPRFFVVETPSVTAVDLGCIYTIEVTERGSGTLGVAYGEVELAAKGRRSLVAAGTAAGFSHEFGPGTPYPLASSLRFREAVAAFDSGAADSAAVAAVLEEARGQGTITLWHLLPRVTDPIRVRLYDRLSALAPPPAGVTRDGVLALDTGMLARWEGALRPTWSSEPRTWWQRALIRIGLHKPAVRLRLGGGG